MRSGSRNMDVRTAARTRYVCIGASVVVYASFAASLQGRMRWHGEGYFTCRMVRGPGGTQEACTTADGQAYLKLKRVWHASPEALCRFSQGDALQQQPNLPSGTRSPTLQLYPAPG